MMPNTGDVSQRYTGNTKVGELRIPLNPAKPSGQDKLDSLSNMEKKLSPVEAGALLKAIYEAEDVAGVTNAIKALPGLSPARGGELVSLANEWRKERAAHRSITCFHYGDTKHSEVAKKYLELIRDADTAAQDVSATGHGPLGFINTRGNRDYSIHYDPQNHVDNSGENIPPVPLSPSIAPTTTPTNQVSSEPPKTAAISPASSKPAPSLAPIGRYDERKTTRLNEIEGLANTALSMPSHNIENGTYVRKFVLVDFVKVGKNTNDIVTVVSLCSRICSDNPPKPEVCYLFVDKKNEGCGLVQILNPVKDIHKAIKEDSTIHLNYDFNNSANYYLSTINEPDNLRAPLTEDEKNLVASNVAQMRESRPYLDAMNELRNRINSTPNAEENEWSTALTNILYYQGSDEGGDNDPKFRAIFEVGYGGYNNQELHNKYLYCGITSYNNGNYEVMEASDGTNGSTKITDNFKNFYMFIAYNLSENLSLS